MKLLIHNKKGEDGYRFEIDMHPTEFEKRCLEYGLVEALRVLEKEWNKEQFKDILKRLKESINLFDNHGK